MFVGGTSGTVTFPILLLTLTMPGSCNPYVDDHAEDAKDELSDNTPDDPDSHEARIRQEDERDFKMPEIYSGHPSRLVLDAPYRIPHQLLTPAVGTSSLSPHLAPLLIPSEAPSKPRLFLADSRDPTPAYDLPRGLTPMTNPASSPRPSPFPSDARSKPHLFLPDSRDPTPTYRAALLQWLTQRGCPGPPLSLPAHPKHPPSTHSRPSSPDPQHRSKCPRPQYGEPLEPPPLDRKGKAPAVSAPGVAQFLDLQAYELDCKDAPDDDESDMSDSDVDFIDDQPLEEGSVHLPHVVQLDDGEGNRRLALYFKDAAAGHYGEGDDDSSHEDYLSDDEEQASLPKSDPQLLSAVSEAVRQVFPVPPPTTAPRGFLPIGTWLCLRNKYKSKYQSLLAITVSFTQCVIRCCPVDPNQDTCRIVDDVDPPLLTIHYSRRVYPTVKELLPFQCSALKELEGLIDFLIPNGTWIRLKGRKHKGQLALVLLPAKCLVARPRYKEEMCLRPTDDPCEVVELRGLQCQFPTTAPTLGDRVVLVNLPESFHGKSNRHNFSNRDDAWILAIINNYKLKSLTQDYTVSEDQAATTTTLLRLIPMNPELSVDPRLSQPARYEHRDSRLVLPKCMVRHAVSPAPSFCVLDRVKYRTTNGNYIGWVTAVNWPWVTIRGVDKKTNKEITYNAEAWQVRRWFSPGDAVTVTASKHKSRQGIVVCVAAAGFLEIFDAEAVSSGVDAEELPWLPIVTHVDFHIELAPDAGDYSQRVAVLHPNMPAPPPPQSRQAIKLATAADEAADLAEQKARAAAFKAVSPADFAAVLNAQAVLNQKRQSLKNVGKRFENIPAQALELRKHIHGDTRGIMVSFKETIGNRLVTVPIEQLAHNATRLPLAQAIYLPNKVLFAEATRGVPPPQQQTRPPTPPPSEAENVPSWGIDQEFESARLPGEDTGEWLCSDAVVNKHIDVLIQGIKSFGGSNKMKAMPKLMTLEGNIGIVMSNAKRWAVSLKLKKIDVFRIGPPAGKQQLMEPVPGPYLRPLRTNDDGTSITTTQGRVVVLGPDVQGNASAVGQYGETQPLIPHDHGKYVVAVRFPGAGHCFYHVLHLCRSLNELAYCGDGTFPVTVF
ncbi:hypothetical protein FB451DRAFT_1387605 [Mycena latifolia]|nr:hypothetical protein FB451DRAFT_1387605 [Mycena latifolia]